jgi:hypothetical protein
LNEPAPGGSAQSVQVCCKWNKLICNVLSILNCVCLYSCDRAIPTHLPNGRDRRGSDRSCNVECYRGISWYSQYGILFRLSREIILVKWSATPSIV